MRALVYGALLLLALVSISVGQLHLALALAGTKALLVGAEYMELRSAARPHALGFALVVVALVGVLTALL